MVIVASLIAVKPAELQAPQSNGYSGPVVSMKKVLTWQFFVVQGHHDRIG